MYNLERQKQILEILSHKKRCSVKELAAALYTSEATVRRDLNALAADGKLQKVFGGALYPERYAEEVPFAVRKEDRVAVKQSICAKAAGLLREGMTLFLDASTTTEQMIPYLKQLRDLQIVTNNPRLPLLLADSPFEIYCTGGRLSHSSQAYVGGTAEDMIRGMNADLFFFSTRGVTEAGVITDSAQMECRLKQAMLAHAEISCFLCDSEKIGPAYLCTVANCADVDYVLSEAELPPALLGRKQRA